MMEAIFGCTVCGQRMVIYRGFEYWRKRDNVNGTTAWRCHEFQHLQCKASLVTSGSRRVSNRLPDHMHEGNIATRNGLQGGRIDERSDDGGPGDTEFVPSFCS